MSSQMLPLSSSAGLNDISHNQVLVAAVIAGFLGQLVKPLTSALQGRGCNWRMALSSGGMPSSHSSFVTAACTALAFKRGLSDSLFGLSLVYAAIVMYDAQGLRRAVGKQAQVINNLAAKTVPSSALVTLRSKSMHSSSTISSNGNGSNGHCTLGGEDKDGPDRPFELEMQTLIKMDSSSSRRLYAEVQALSPSVASRRNELLYRNPFGSSSDKGSIDVESAACSRPEAFFEDAKKFPGMKTGPPANVPEASGNSYSLRHLPLKEGIGHTTVEVLVGGLWGVLITTAVSSFWK